MRYIREVMGTSPLVVGPHMTVERLAQVLLDHGAEAACVVDDDDLVGVVTSTDLSYRDKNLHLPTVFAMMDLVVTLGMKGVVDDAEKVFGGSVRDIMTPDPFTTTPDATLADVVTAMIERRIGIVPVLGKNGEIVGALTRRLLLAWIAAGRPDGRVVKD